METLETLTMKFGGTSLGSAQAIRQAAEITKGALSQSARRAAVVASAVDGVTDLLQNGLLSAAAGESGFRQITEELEEIHWRCAEAITGTESELLIEEIGELLDNYAELCEGVSVLGEAGPRALDHAMSLGERMSVLLMAAALRQIGVASVAIDATKIIVTDDRFQDAAPDIVATRLNVAESLEPVLDAGKTPVITGFIGATPEGVTTTLGRGGSDFSAGLIASCLDSDELWIWTDVDGVMTADPRVVHAAHTIDTLSYDEVRELSYFGAKVLHPRTIQSVQDSGIPIRVKNTFHPSRSGSLIVPQLESGNGAIKAITAISGVSLITVAGKGMLGVPGIAGRTFEAVARTGASVLLISQSSSEQSICFVVRSEDARPAVGALETEFELAMIRQDIDRIWAQDDITIVTVVGSGMRQTPGVAGQVFSATGGKGINVIAIAQGSSECSISLVVQGSDGHEAVRAIHELVIEA
ncbi:MAG: aspartate kinase [Anaerolineales bacterium]